MSKKGPRQRRDAAPNGKKKRAKVDSDDEAEAEELKRRQEESAAAKKAANALQYQLKAPKWGYLEPIVKELWKGEPGQSEPSDELKSSRKAIGVLVKGNIQTCPPPVQSLGAPLPPLFEQYCTAKNITSPTVVQRQCWPAILAGSNVLGIAPTGSGKTLSFLLPALHHLMAQPHGGGGASNSGAGGRQLKALVQVLILAPTRELAIQIQSVAKSLKKFGRGMECGILYGGQDKNAQLDALRSAGMNLKMLVATPGRLLDLLGKGQAEDGGSEINLRGVSFLVLDEADRMLSLGFAEQIQAIYTQLRPDRQVVLFSATFPGRLRELSEQWAPEAVIVRCNTLEVTDRTPANKAAEQAALTTSVANALNEAAAAENESAEPPAKKAKKTTETTETVEAPKTTETVEVEGSPTPVHPKSLAALSSSITVSNTITQKVHVCAPHKRPRLLIKYVEQVRAAEKAAKVRQAGPMIIFCNKISTLKNVVALLDRQQILSVPLHGQLQQSLREENLNALRSGKINIVVATDVAARGIHVKRLRYVVNYDFPLNLEQYCHRIGRCGRQGEAGDAYSLLTRNFAVMSRDLVTLLGQCNQTVEPNLLALAEEYERLGGSIGDAEAEPMGDKNDFEAFAGSETADA